MNFYKVRWHNNKNEKPEYNGPCVCIYHNWQPFVASYNKDGPGFYCNLVYVKVDYWMPLPPQPDKIK